MNKVSLSLVAIIIIVAAVIAGIIIYDNGLNTNNSPTNTPIPTLTTAPSSSPTTTPTYTPITVSGRASSAALAEPYFTSIQEIEFIDVQTQMVTSFNFSFAQNSYNPFGNYAVILQNEHTYNVTINYYMGPSLNDIVYPASDYIATFTVNATAGQAAIPKDFG